MIATATVLLAIALPALAEEPEQTIMWIQRNRLMWTTRAYSSSDLVVAKIHIFDETRSMVDGATVAVTWRFNGDEIGATTGETNRRGIAEFSLPAERGQFQICVTTVYKEGWLYDPDRNYDTECAIANVW
jgi:hypothetical protein